MGGEGDKERERMERKRSPIWTVHTLVEIILDQQTLLESLQKYYRRVIESGY